MMKMREKMYSRKSQQGIVLIVSLLILLVLTMIGISAISNTSLEERMSKNFQQSTMAFQASESAIQRVIVASDPAQPGFDQVNNPLDRAVAAGMGATTTTVTEDMDPLDKLHTSLDTTTTISLEAESPLCPGYPVNTVVCLQFELTTSTAIGGTETGPQHVQGVELPAPRL